MCNWVTVCKEEANYNVFFKQHLVRIFSRWDNINKTWNKKNSKNYEKTWKNMEKLGKNWKKWHIIHVVFSMDYLSYSELVINAKIGSHRWEGRFIYSFLPTSLLMVILEILENLLNSSTILCVYRIFQRIRHFQKEVEIVKKRGGNRIFLNHKKCHYLSQTKIFMPSTLGN